MGTWPTLTQTGGGDWIVYNENITNHEAFAFTLQSSENNIGAYISNITVFTSNDAAPNQTSYFITLQAMRLSKNRHGSWSLNPVNESITGHFESHGV
jgi:hypothetical protein